MLRSVTAAAIAVMAAAAGIMGCSSSSGKPTGSGGSSGAGMGGSGGKGTGGGSGGIVGAGGSDAGIDHPVGSGGTDGGSGGIVGAGGSDGGIDQIVEAGNAEGGTVHHCHTNADCLAPDAGLSYGVCFINAPITDCTTAPEGICVLEGGGGNCGTHPNVCDCLLPVVPTTACDIFPGTMCNGTRDTDFSARCWGCFIVPDASSSDGPSDGDGG